MARTLDPRTHALRRDAFVAAALRLIQSRGYERFSVQDVLDELNASKGAFYHYFDSKQALLEAVINQVADAGTAALVPVVEDPSLDAPTKLSRVFTTLQQWKTQRKDLILALLEVWLSDENSVVREQLRREIRSRLTPLISTIVRQGNQEGTFTVGSPERVAWVLVALIQGASEVAGELFVARQAKTIPLETVEETFAAYSDALERILGVSSGTLALMHPDTVHEWFA